MRNTSDTIVAVSTAIGQAGIAVIRMSGPDSRKILKKVWKGAEPLEFKSHTSHLGWILDAGKEEIDQVVATFFKGPNSYTGEDIVEISCHGSMWIQQEIVKTLIEKGAVPARGGEFTQRAFINGKLDLAQAEGVADMISASSKAAAKIATTQLKGDYSRRLEQLRRQLVEMGVLLELELDFSEEDVEFADRTHLIEIANELLSEVKRLASSFNAGKAFKNGIPVAIAGVPNAGKSTLLNSLLEDDKAIVSDIPGTTRDVIEDTVEISGLLFRFIDTAGLRESDNEIERIGIEKARKKIEEAGILLFLIDPTQDMEVQTNVLEEIYKAHILSDSKKSGGNMGNEERLDTIKIFTKADLKMSSAEDGLSVSASTGCGIEELKQKLVELATKDYNPNQELIVTNARHYTALKDAIKPLEKLIQGLREGLSSDFLAQDLREADRYLSEITGVISSEEILHSIFARYCIGK